ncbi:hypothetical protein [Roseibium sp.]|uniref:hypothetical protein n=1 Tax=Roseibium sp. TaxID=1936156 RepID=UPI0032671D68
MVAGSRAPGRIVSAGLIAVGLLAGLTGAQAQSEAASPPAAFQNALDAFDQAWTASGLAFTRVTFTDSPSTGYGQYTPRGEAVFTGEDPLSVYAEPVGYGFRETGTGYDYELTASFRLLTPAGQVLAEQDNFATFSGSGRTRQRELSAALSFEFSGLPAGAYRIETRFKDEIGGTQSAFTLPFTVTGAATDAN